jgi:GNAT superfamily N-acetyltransferase
MPAQNHSPGYLVRAAVADDAPALSALAIRSKAHWGYDNDFMALCRAELSWRAEDIQSGTFDVQCCIRDGQLLAFYALERIDSHVIELEALFVEPRHIGTGLGRMMIEHAKKRSIIARASRMLIQGDPHAETFYLAAGALPCGSRESASVPGRYLPLFEIRLGEPSGDMDNNNDRN